MATPKATPAMTAFFDAKKDVRLHDKQCAQCRKAAKIDDRVDALEARCEKGQYLIDRMDHKQTDAF